MSEAWGLKIQIQRTPNDAANWIAIQLIRFGFNRHFQRDWQLFQNLWEKIYKNKCKINEFLCTDYYKMRYKT